MSDDKLSLQTLLGVGLTLEEYQKQVLDGHAPYYETHEVRFECTECGKCCTRPGQVYLTELDIARIADFFSMTEEEVKISMLTRSASHWVIQVDEGSDCVFFRNDRCRIHPVKPTQCRTYPFWPEVVSQRHDWRRERHYCPGIGEGRVYKAEEIRAILLGGKATWE